MHHTNETEIITIPLKNADQPARIDRAGYERVRAAGFKGAWFLAGDGHGYNYVMTSDNSMVGANFPVARIAAGAEPRQVVRYKDGNRFNLCAWNLKVCKGFSKVRKAKPTTTNTGETA